MVQKPDRRNETCWRRGRSEASQEAGLRCRRLRPAPRWRWTEHQHRTSHQQVAGGRMPEGQLSIPPVSLSVFLPQCLFKCEKMTQAFPCIPLVKVWIFCFLLRQGLMPCSSGWPQTCYVAEDALKFLILLPYFSSAGVTDVKHHAQLINMECGLV